MAQPNYLRVVTLAAAGVAIALSVCLLGLLNPLKPAHAAYPGTNGPIVFDRDYNIWSVNPDNSEEKQLTSDGVNGLTTYSSPAVSPDGKKIAFKSNKSGPLTNDYRWHTVWVMNADGTGEPKQISGSPTNYSLSLTWSPNNDEVAFNDKDGYFRVAKADGSSQRDITPQDGGGGANPAWSPDGTKIAFERGASPNNPYQRIWVMNADGSEPKQVSRLVSNVCDPRLPPIPGQTCDGSLSPDTTSFNFDSQASWSPDSKQLAFTTNRQGGGEIWSVELATSQEKTLRSIGDGGGVEPAWSPDGKQIAFVGNSANNIFVMNNDGSAQKQITNTSGHDRRPNWGTPVPKLADTTKPTITLNTPTDGATYTQGQSVNADYSCSDDTSSGSDLSCTGTVPSGSPIDTSSVGTKTFKVTATDKAGNTADPKSVSYSVVAPPCDYGEILAPVNNVSSATESGMSKYKYGSRGVIPVKFKVSCDGNLIDTKAEADAHPMKLKLTKLGSTPEQDAVVETTEPGTASTGDLFTFNGDPDNFYKYGIDAKNLARGTYKITIYEAYGRGSHDEWFSIY